MNILKQTDKFALFETGYQSHRQYRIRCKVRKSSPKGRRISERDKKYLLGCGDSFDAACVVDFGVGVFQQKR